MQSDLSLILRRVPQADEIRIYPIADIHWGSLACNDEEWQDFVQYIRHISNSYIILGGDLINNNTRSSVGSPWDDRIRPREQKRQMAKMLEPLRDKILCAVSGNHERRSLKDADDDPMYDVLAKLDLEEVYRENTAFLKLGIGNRTRGDEREREKATNSYVIAVTHGSGGGMYTGASVNRNERFGTYIDGIDALIVGHSHKGSITKPAKIAVDAHNNKITVKPFVVLSSTSWQAWGGYAAQKMLQPSATDRQYMILDGRRDRKNITVVW